MKFLQKSNSQKWNVTAKFSTALDSVFILLNFHKLEVLLYLQPKIYPNSK